MIGLDVFVDRFGCDGPELAERVSNAAEFEINSACDAVLASAELPTLDPKTDVVRPLVNARMGTLHVPAADVEYAVAPAFGGLNLLTATDPRFSGSSSFARAVARTLLYCHELALEDPLALAAHMYRGAPVEYRGAARRIVEASVVTCLELDLLVRPGVVHLFWVPADRERRTQEFVTALTAIESDRKGDRWVDEAWDAFEAVFVDGLDPQLQELWRRVRAGDRFPDLALLEGAIASGEPSFARLFIEVVAGLQPAAVVQNVVETLAVALDDIDALGGRADLYAPSRVFTRIILAATTGPQDPDADRLRELARLEVPRLDDLDWSDIVSIRRDDEAFELWRVHLGRGLDRARRERERGDWASARRAIAEELAEARVALDRAATRSKVIRRAAHGSIAFALGAIGAAIGTGDPTGFHIALPAIGAGVGAGVPAALDRERPNPAVRRHYVLFEPP